mmetsp:Transcript_2386/g.8973  ORF Transcript_2386/g.8973 Transcript_2386/m.8973 type:complete len:142 (-) Transcript_2386:8252-8677(-)
MTLLPSLVNDIFTPFDPFTNLDYPIARQQRKWLPAVDIKENDKEICLDMNVPGFNKDDICVDLDQNMLVLKGKHSEEKKEDEGTWHRRERRKQSFERRFTLPEYASLDQIKANLQNGVLHLSVPKKEQPKPEKSHKSIEIQ